MEITVFTKIIRKILRGATYSNAVRHGAFSKEANNFSNQDEAYYDWQVTEDRELASGIVYKHYSFINFNQNIYAIEIDMNNPKVTFETVMADEICPNPNGNNNSNNGKVLREILIGDLYQTEEMKEETLL